jgi:hypothetical protein
VSRIGLPLAGVSSGHNPEVEGSDPPPGHDLRNSPPPAGGAVGAVLVHV